MYLQIIYKFPRVFNCASFIARSRSDLSKFPWIIPCEPLWKKNRWARFTNNYPSNNNGYNNRTKLYIVSTNSNNYATQFSFHIFAQIHPRLRGLPCVNPSRHQSSSIERLSVKIARIACPRGVRHLSVARSMPPWPL